MEPAMPDLQYRQKYVPEANFQENGADAMKPELTASVRHNFLGTRRQGSFRIRMPVLLPAGSAALLKSKSVTRLIC